MIRWMRMAALLTVLGSIGLGGGSAHAAVTVGQLAPVNPPDDCLPGADDFLQPTVISGNSYVVPGNGTITSWSHQGSGSSSGPQTLTMKVFRKVADPFVYMAVGHDGPRPVKAGSLIGYPTSIPVKAGDVLGLNTDGPNATACWFHVPFESFLFQGPLNLPDGAFAEFVSSDNTAIDDERLNISAVFEPSNSFTLGKVTSNKRKGTATLTVDVPNPGELTASGKGVKASAAPAEISKAVGAGPTELLIKAKGKRKKTLNATGKVKLNVAVTYTPTNGNPGTQPVKVKLKRR